MLGTENVEGKSCVADGEGEKKTFQADIFDFGGKLSRR